MLCAISDSNTIYSAKQKWQAARKATARPHQAGRPLLHLQLHALLIIKHAYTLIHTNKSKQTIQTRKMPKCYYYMHHDVPPIQ